MHKTDKGRGPHKYNKNNENNKYSDNIKSSEAMILVVMNAIFAIA